MRKYQPIWEQIKKYRRAKIIAPPNLHKRIIQAVRKEKASDYPFRNLAKSKGARTVLKDFQDSDKGIVEFRLYIHTSIQAKDL